MSALLQRVCEYAAHPDVSDIHLRSDNRIYLRIDGEIRPEPADCMVSADELYLFVEHCMSIELKQRWLNDRSLDLGIELGGYRCRANFYFELNRPAAVLRIVSDEVPTLKAVGMPAVISDVLVTHHGLVLMSGATGAGKSTSLAAMVRHILDTRTVHILTIEDPVEFRFNSRRSLISQREVGSDVPCFAAALRAAVREDPDVILIGEMRDLETIELALSAAETGHLVLATLHTASCDGAISRIVDVFPAAAREQVRIQLANSLRMVVNQRLLRRSDKCGRVAAFEVLLANDAVRNLIRENKAYQLPSVMDTACAQGMVSMRSALAALRAAGLIDAEAETERAVAP